MKKNNKTFGVIYPGITMVQELNMDTSLYTVARRTARIAAVLSVLCSANGFAEGAPDYRIGSFGVQSPFHDSHDDAVGVASEQRSEMLFKLSAGNDAALSGAEDEAGATGEISVNRIDFLKPGEARMQDVHNGFFYSASVDLEGKEAFESESQLISSRQLGIHYGRLGSVNYSGVDLSFRQFNAAEGQQESEQELWSLGVTTGRRFSMTGLDPSDPLWTVSLRGQFNFTEQADERIEVGDQQWYLSPGLHWQRDNFQLSADVLMPFMQSGDYETETDYRVRANIKKRF